MNKKFYAPDFIWNEINLSGDQIERLISFLKTLDNSYLDNLKAAHSHEGTVEFFWKSEKRKHIVGTGIDIPDGDWWNIIDNHFQEITLT